MTKARSANSAMYAVLSAKFETVGGNIRVRDHPHYQPRQAATPTPLHIDTKEGGQ